MELLRFTIGSITKGFTSYMAGKQVFEGLYGWKDKITEVFAKKNIKMSLQGDFRSVLSKTPSWLKSYQL